MVQVLKHMGGYLLNGLSSGLLCKTLKCFDFCVGVFSEYLKTLCKLLYQDIIGMVVCFQ